jgi:hypothetical protein
MSEVDASMATACEESVVDVGARRWVTHCSASKYATIETPPPHTAVSQWWEGVYKLGGKGTLPPTHTYLHYENRTTNLHYEDDFRGQYPILAQRLSR